MSKKIICLCLVFTLLLSLFSCGKKPDDKEEYHTRTVINFGRRTFLSADFVL